MNATTFLTLLSFFSAITGLTVEGLKNTFKKAYVVSYNLIALSVALIVGTFGTIIYYVLHETPFSLQNFVYAILMGLASALVSMVGYDKIVQLIAQFSKTNKY